MRDKANGAWDKIRDKYKTCGICDKGIKNKGLCRASGYYSRCNLNIIRTPSAASRSCKPFALCEIYGDTYVADADNVRLTTKLHAGFS
jgi:hypothetical protein